MDVQSVAAHGNCTGRVCGFNLASMHLMVFYLMVDKFAREPIIKTVAKHVFTLTYFLVGIDVPVQCPLVKGSFCS